VSTVGVTSAADASADARRPAQRYGRIIVVGGGCYGSYYVRQLRRGERAGAIAWDELVVVDRDPACAVAALAAGDRPPRMRLVTARWDEYFARYLAAAADDESRLSDAIVPSPLMPHLMADWLAARARERWPRRAVRVAPIDEIPSIPWQRSGEDGTRYVSFAEWICPINCIEPARCPHTRGDRTWSLPVAIRSHAVLERPRGDEFGLPLLFHCTHRVFGVGMIDVRDVLDADSAIANAGHSGEARFVIGTVSHCHGALRRLSIGAA
jgi:hypothetical protein